MQDEREFNGIIYTRIIGHKDSNRRDYFRKGQKYLHRAIWEYHNGKIPFGYHIHHIDENTLNNSIENLECLSPADHRRKHYNSESLSKAAKKGWSQREKTEKICNYCNKKYSIFHQTRSKFCSATCTTEARVKSGVDDVKMSCIECKELFYCNKYKKRLTCSRVCADIVSSRTKKMKRIHGSGAKLAVMITETFLA